MALFKVIEDKSGHVNSYWNVGKFVLSLNKECIDVVLYGYKNKDARYSKAPSDSREYKLQIDKNHPDLKYYDDLILDYTNLDNMELKSQLKVKLNWQHTIVPNITLLIKGLLDYCYWDIAQRDEFLGSKNI